VSETVEQEQQNVDLRNKRSFTARREIWGMPSEIFIGTCVVTVFGVVVLMTYMGLWVGIFGGLLLAMIVMVPVYLVHRDDPDGAMVWLKGLFAPESYDPGLVTKRSVRLIQLDSHKVIVKPLHKEA